VWTLVDSLRHSTSTGIQSPQEINMVVYGRISACTTSCELVGLDRPMIRSPGLVTLARLTVCILEDYLVQSINLDLDMIQLSTGVR